MGLRLYSFTFRPARSFHPTPHPFLPPPRKVFPREISLWFSTFSRENSFIKQRTWPDGKSFEVTMAERILRRLEKNPIRVTPPFTPFDLLFSPGVFKRIVVLLFDWKGASPFVDLSSYEATLSNCFPTATTTTQKSIPQSVSINFFFTSRTTALLLIMLDI